MIRNKISSSGERIWSVWARNKDVFMKTAKTNFIPPILQPLLYLLSLGFGLGLFIKEIEGISYAVYLAPGLIAISIMDSSVYECMYGSFIRMYYQKTFDAIIATPISLDEVVIGEVLWGTTKSVLNSTIVLIVTIFLGLVKSPLAVMVIPVSIISGLLFSSLSMSFTALVPNIDSFNYPISLFIMPMFLFTGTFFPLTVLPKFIQVISYWFLPLTHVSLLVRSFTVGIISSSLFFNMIWIITVTSIFLPISIILMRRRLII